MSTSIPMTVLGAELLKKELTQLKNKDRKEVIEAISTARAHGDLRENAEYHAAKERQAFIEGRIKEIESKLANAEVIDITKLTNNGKVVFGSTIELFCDESSITYTIVGEDEADLKANKISYKSPLARALIGKLEGDSVEVSTPSGFKQYDIDKVVYGENVNS